MARRSPAWLCVLRVICASLLALGIVWASQGRHEPPQLAPIHIPPPAVLNSVPYPPMPTPLPQAKESGDVVLLPMLEPVSCGFVFGTCRVYIKRPSPDAISFLRPPASLRWLVVGFLYAFAVHLAALGFRFAESSRGKVSRCREQDSNLHGLAPSGF